MADDAQEILAYEEVNAMDGEPSEMHEMADINGDVPGKEDVEPEAGISNDAYDGDEETGLVLNDATEETSFKDNGHIPTVQENSSVDEEGTMNDTETATEYENQSTIKSYQNEDELETPEFTPPGSPNHTEKHTAINMENGTDEDKIKFVQYEGADDETTRLESRAKFKRKTDWKCICLSLLCFLVMILAAAFAFFIAMFLQGSLNEVFGRDDSPKSTIGPPALPTGPTIQAPPIDMITVLTQINMVQDWNIAYDFPSSPERTKLENDVIRAMDSTFRWGNTKYVYEKTEIEEFRQGPNGESIYVRFLSSFYDVPGGVLSAPMDSTPPSPDALYDQAREEMAYAVIKTLAAAIDAGRLKSIGAAQGTIELLLVDVARG